MEQDEMDKLIARINELAKKSKNDTLTEEELKERDDLRRIYIANFKKNLKSLLSNIEIVDDKK